MLKDFWEKKKELFQFVGIITAVGAIFLTIPSQSNPTAEAALLNIQFIWLLLISISVLIMLFTFYYFFTKMEQEISKKYDIFLLQGSLSYLMMGLVVTFCINLWQV